MNISTDKLIQKILDFMAVLYHCYASTTHSEDRIIYAKDIAAAMGWIVELKEKGDVKTIIDKILSPETDKHFGDYWRQGEWGDKEADALKKLKSEIKA
ncbi:MAG TPA: hypothetical protein DCE52_06105 [Rhodobacteraceae bacterium]|nr:hypothetical protein [Paracoccaceae bacterium]